MQGLNGGARQRHGEELLAEQRADEIPADVLAERDSEERRLRDEPLVAPETEAVPEAVLAERDEEARAADEELRRKQAGG
jgi:hypothetical protein